ncbi:phage terminase large subunit-like protein [Sphingomonas faeni]|uniref:Phage terminase large subunit-like protein n=1 Tax=Sphingomonas faeni TaxID=185950 RepID=A0A2T5UCY3_9SPHN|nr:terminase TerL endonuclease subunit [Sphingomonas faeni]PTW49353.1 phage terminase large subunit-like protein [Sphingomonas faeni]
MPKPTLDHYSERAIAYAKAVKARKIPACIQVRQACARYLDDFKRKDIVYAPERVEHVCEFAELLPHVIGPLTGELIELEPFQIFIFANLFGWLDAKTRLRRYREAFILLPRGNAKSTIAAIIGLYMTFAENQGGAEGLSGATSMQQAEAVFIPAKRMVEMTPDLAEFYGLEVAARSIYQTSTGSSFKPVIAKTKDGGLPWIAIADELHQALDDTQLNAFRTGMGKRRGSDPLLLIISTAGTNVAGVCRQEQLYFEAVLSGSMKDDRKFALIYTIDPKDDWTDFKVWQKANPNYGVSVDEDHLRSEYEKALQSPSHQATCKTKYLNVWTNTATGWLNQRDWASAASPGLLLSSTARTWIGVDLSTKTDITAIVVVQELPDGKRAIVPFLYLPKGALERSKNAKAYTDWIASGAIHATEGSASDHAAVEDMIRALKKDYQVQSVLFDSWQAAGMMQRLEADGIECVEFGQTAKNFTAPMIDFEAELMNGNIVHDDNPCLNWMASNISVRQMGPLKSPTKPTGQDHLKIDGMVAALMAYAQSEAVEAPKQEPFLMFM